MSGAASITLRVHDLAPVPGRSLFCVVGSPIDHSKSPLIHRAFAEANGIDLEYVRVQVGRGELCHALERFAAVGGRGMNVTVPLKEEAAAAATQASDRVRQAGAANTLTIAAGGDHIEADNTDGEGLMVDLEDNLNFALGGARVLLLGAGGAARGVVASLLERNPAELVIANRTVSRAGQLAERFGSGGAAISAVGFDQLPQGAFDCVINATSLSLNGGVPPIDGAVVAAGTLCYDMAYGSEPTPFVRWCRTHGAERAVDGLGMLVEQAAEAFAIWHGSRPATAPVLEALRRSD